MKDKLGSVALGFFLLGTIAWMSWRVVEFFVTSLVQSDPRISASIVGAMATVFVGLSVTIFTQWQIRIREAEEAHRTKKVEIYDEFLKIISSVIAGANSKLSIEAPREEELTEYLFEFKRKIILWGSPEVIKCQLEFENATESGKSIFVAVDNLYKAIRKDIGLSNKGLENLELVKMYLLDEERSKVN